MALITLNAAIERLYLDKKNVRACFSKCNGHYALIPLVAPVHKAVLLLREKSSVCEGVIGRRVQDCVQERENEP